ncbi:MAG: 3-oxoacyl-[acyl-carrier-protein] synthase III C-terminal domain-containing protein [Gemmatimonadaceae bacterium]
MADRVGSSVGIDAASYWLPPETLTLDQLGERGALRSAPDALAGFGFRQVRIADAETHVDMALHAARSLLCEAAIDPEEIDFLFFAGGLTSSSTMIRTPAPAGAVLHMHEVSEFFRYPASYVQSELGLTNAAVAGIDQQGCASIFSAMRMARAILMAEEDKRLILCIGADRLPAGAPREMVYNAISDGAAAVLLRRGATQNRIIACHQITKGTLWETDSQEHEVVAAYFPTARSVILDTLRRARLTMRDMRWIIPHNVSLRSWEILLGLLEVPSEKLYSTNIARVGHTIAADNIINLRDATDAGLLKSGDLLLLFTFGYGLNWSCMIVEH